MEVNAIGGIPFAGSNYAVMAVRSAMPRTRSQRFSSGETSEEPPTSQRVPIELVAQKIADSLVRSVPDMTPDIAMQIAKRAVFSRDEAVAATANRRGSKYIEDQLGSQVDVTA